jgi:uncharacterized protein YqeY
VGLRDRLRAELTQAMKARDQPAVRALRAALAAIGNAEAVEASADALAPPSAGDGPIVGAVAGLGAAEVPRRMLDESDVAAVLGDEIAERRAAAETFELAGEHGRAATLRAEADVLARFTDQ